MNKFTYLQLLLANGDEDNIELSKPLKGLVGLTYLNTRGGVIFWCMIFTILSVLSYQHIVSLGIEASQVGACIGPLLVLFFSSLWTSTYVFRVATKDMTYAKQLRDYENAVLQKRLDELAQDEIQALIQEINSEDLLPASAVSRAGVETDDSRMKPNPNPNPMK